MPQANIWIRKDDWEAWRALQNKSEWLHEHLTRTAETTMREIKLPQFEQTIKIQRNVNLCKNGHVVDDYGYCLALGCQYSR